MSLGTDAHDGERQLERFESPEPPHTGDLAVDEAIQAVARAVERPLEEQVAAYDAAHRALQDRLADVEG